MEALIIVSAFAALIYLVTRLVSLNSSKGTDLEARLDELELQGFRDVGHLELDIETYRVVTIHQEGYEGHVLLEVCKQHLGYTSYHYDENGKFVGEKYVGFNK